jgi:hypothetical protein
MLKIKFKYPVILAGHATRQTVMSEKTNHVVVIGLDDLAQRVLHLQLMLQVLSPTGFKIMST